MMTGRSIRELIFLCSSLAIVACSAESGTTAVVPDGGECSSDRDCDNGTCEGGICVADEPVSDAGADTGIDVGDPDTGLPDVTTDLLDSDNDGIPDDGDESGSDIDNRCEPGETSGCDDNCPLTPNADQADQDGDGVGDVCDPDRDGDGINEDGDDSGTEGDSACSGTALDDCDDNCPDDYNPEQLDRDSDGVGDACDPPDGDRDNDGVPDAADNCPDTPNADQSDRDGDGIGDVCDSDSDGDGVDDVLDNCPTVPNPDQADRDNDGIGDVCDDGDGDGIFDDEDNCPTVPNSAQQDSDLDGIGDACDDDRDGDDVDNGDDNCPDTPNPLQTDSDLDGIGDACDGDTVFRRGFYGSDAACVFEPVIGDFSPSLEWAFSVSEGDAFPNHRQVMMTPLVVNLTDDNDDGVINADDIPDVVITTFNTVTRVDDYDYLREGYVRALSGDGSGLLWTATTPVAPAGNLAAADIDGDGEVEIVGLRFNFSNSAEGGFVAFNHDGSVLWTSAATPRQAETYWGGPSLADLDGNGTVEVVFGNVVLNGADGSARWTGAATGRGDNAPGGSFPAIAPLSTVANINAGSPGLEVVTGNAYYSATGAVLWSDASRTDGFVAVADFGGTSAPEVVVVHSGRVRIQDASGAIVWGPVQVERHPDAPTTEAVGRLGPPTVADFDGDGDREIGIAARGQYIALDVDLSTPTPSFASALLWRYRTIDFSSSTTGSSVFDFDGDRKAEVVYNDEQYLRVFDGSTGTVLFEAPNGSYTAAEYPVIADVDNDGNAEIVVVSNNFEDLNFTPGPFAGVRIYGDAGDNWVATRRIWNQHAYTINNVREDGSIPTAPTNAWDTHNTFRLNIQGEGEVFASPDLVASEGDVEAEYCDVSVGLWVSNRGATTIRAGVPVTFYLNGDRANPANRRTLTTRFDLAPGDGEFVQTAWTFTAGVTNSMTIIVDDPGDGSSLTSECNEDNNEIVVDDIECVGI